jgi:hypothetical protein
LQQRLQLTPSVEVFDPRRGVEPRHPATAR